MRAAFALRIFSGKIIYNFAILENLRIFQNCLFTGGVVEENGICIACGDATFPKGTALAVAAKFPAQVQSLRACSLPPWGSCRAATEGFQIGGAGKNG